MISVKLTNFIQTAFIEQLQRQAYEYLDIKDEAGLIANLRRQIKRLNNVKFSDGDWDRFFRNEIAKENLDIIEKTKKIQDKDTAIYFRFEDYWYGYDDEKTHRHNDGYMELINRLRTEFPIGGQIVGEKAQAEFVKLFGNILRARNILTSFDEFTEMDIIQPRELQDQQSRYIEMYETLRPDPASRESITDDVVFEMELIRHVDIGIDYILALIEKYHDSN